MIYNVIWVVILDSELSTRAGFHWSSAWLIWLFQMKYGITSGLVDPNLFVFLENTSYLIQSSPPFHKKFLIIVQHCLKIWGGIATGSITAV